MMHYIDALLSGPMSGVYIACIVCAVAIMAVVGLVTLAIWSAHNEVFRLLQAHRGVEAMYSCEEYNDK